MNENSVVFFFIFSRFCDSIIKCSSCQNDFKPLSSESLYTFNLKFGSDGWHENGTLDLESMTTVSDTLSMITRTGSNNTSAFFLFCKTSESICCASDFEASNGLHILSFEVDFSIVFFGKVLRFSKGSVHNDSFAFSIRLINSIGRDEFRFMFPIDLIDTVDLGVHHLYVFKMTEV